MSKETLSNIQELFEEFDASVLHVSDFGIITNGVRVDNIHLTDEGNIQIWCGNPDNDKYAEELLLNESEKQKIFEDILKNFHTSLDDDEWEPFTLIVIMPGDKHEFLQGYYQDVRLSSAEKKDMLEKHGLHAYDLREDDDGENYHSTIEKTVMVNHSGTFLTKTHLPFGETTPDGATFPTYLKIDNND